MIQAYPGCYLVKTSEEKAEISLTTEKTPDRILKGEIIDVGAPMEQKSGGVLKAKLKKGDTIYFLSYDGGYDYYTTASGETYYFVLFEDGRGYEEK